MNKTFIFLLIGILMINCVSALDWDNIKTEEEITFDGKLVKGNTLLERYKPIKITNALGLGEILLEGYLSQHDDVCGKECESTIEIKLHQDGILVDDIKFKGLHKNGKWLNTKIKDYDIQYLGEVADYIKDCNIIGKHLNGTDDIECNFIISGTRIDWINYEERQEVDAGIYTVKIIGNKRKYETVDWIIKTNGEWLESWATWGNISEGDDAEVILNAPENNSIELLTRVTFNATANVTGGESLTNMSLYTNESGVWEAKNSTEIGGVGNITEVGLISYYRMDDNAANTNVDDTEDFSEGTASANTNTMSVSGKINTALNFTGSESISLATDTFQTLGGEFTHSFWINPSNVGTGLRRVYSTPNINNFIGHNNGVFIYRFDTNTQTCTLAPSLSQSVGTWYNMVTIYNDTANNLTLWQNGVVLQSVSCSGTVLTTAGTNTIGSEGGGTNGWEGKIDEMGLWSNAFNSTQISSLYNSGNGERPSGTTSQTQTWIRTLTESTLWNVEACDSDGGCGFATENRTVSIDTQVPEVTILYPTGQIGTLIEGQSVDLNYTISDEGLDSCWYNYNGTNTTISNCLLNTTFNYSSGVNTITVYANDTVGNMANDTSTWTLLFSVLNQTYDENSFVTAFNDFEVYISSEASSILSPKLVYDNQEYSATLNIVNSSLFYLTSSIVNNESVVGNNSFFWNITLDGTESSSSTSYQNVFDINFSICDVSNNATYLSIDFKDELTLESINATIRTSTFTYYIEDVSASKIYTYSSPTNQSNYDFCFDPPITNITTAMSISYYGEDYPERTFGTDLILSNETTDQTLDLLDDSSGIYATFRFIDSTTKIGLSSVNVQIYDGIDLVIEKTTDDSGAVSEWLNPNILYEVVYVKSGYTSGTQSHRPISTEAIIIEMSSEALIPDPSLTNGLTQYYYPQSTDLDENTSYNFGFYTSEGQEEIDTMKFTIYDEDGIEIYSPEKSEDGNMSQQPINTTQNKTLLGIYEINGVDGGYYKFTRTYYVTVVQSSQYSLDQWGTSFNSYFPAGERSTLTNLVWYIIWFIFMLGGFTFGYNGSFKTREDYTDNVTSATRGNTTVGLFFAFLITLIFTYFNLIPMPVGVINPGFLIPDAWMEQNFFGLIILVVLVWDVIAGITKHSRRGN